jgi:hypothetical protein
MAMWNRLKALDWLDVWKRRSPVIGGIILVGIVCYATYLAISVFASLEKELKAAFIAGLAAFGVALTTNYVQKKREMDFKIRERKIEAYQKVFDFLLFFLRSTKNDGLSDTEAVVSRIHEVNYSLLVWGSDLTIKAWQEFFRSLANLDFQKLDRPDLTLHTFILRNKLAELILLIRKDLGHVDKGIDVSTIADTYMPINFTPEDWHLMDEALRRYATVTPPIST